MPVRLVTGAGSESGAVNSGTTSPIGIIRVVDTKGDRLWCTPNHSGEEKRKKKKKERKGKVHGEN